MSRPKGPVLYQQRILQARRAFRTREESGRGTAWAFLLRESTRRDFMTDLARDFVPTGHYDWSRKAMSLNLPYSQFGFQYNMASVSMNLNPEVLALANQPCSIPACGSMKQFLPTSGMHSQHQQCDLARSDAVAAATLVVRPFSSQYYTCQAVVSCQIQLDQHHDYSTHTTHTLTRRPVKNA